MATTLTLERAIYSSGPYEVRELPEAASQSWEPGEFVEFTSDSAVEACASGDVTTIGIAMGYATGTTGAAVEVLLANNGTTFEMTISGGSDPTFATTDLGVKYALLVAANRSLVNIDDSDGNDIFVINSIKKDADAGINIAGDDYVRAFVQVAPEAFQFGDAGE
jgi:hypothetical protein